MASPNMSSASASASARNLSHDEPELQAVTFGLDTPQVDFTDEGWQWYKECELAAAWIASLNAFY